MHGELRLHLSISYILRGSEDAHAAIYITAPESVAGARRTTCAACRLERLNQKDVQRSALVRRVARTGGRTAGARVRQSVCLGR